MKRRGAKQERNFAFFQSHVQSDSWALTFAFIACRVASLTGLCALLLVMMLWAGAMTLSLGAEQIEEGIAGQAVCGLWAPARLAAPATPLTPPCGVFCVISGPKREAKFQYPALL